MSKIDCCNPKEAGASSVIISIDVTKIVKYACCTAIVIVGIIFGTKSYQKMLEKGLIKFD